MKNKEAYDFGWLISIALVAYLVYTQQTTWALIALSVGALAVALNLAAKVIERRKK